MIPYRPIHSIVQTTNPGKDLDGLLPETLPSEEGRVRTYPTSNHAGLFDCPTDGSAVRIRQVHVVLKNGTRARAYIIDQDGGTRIIADTGPVLDLLIFFAALDGLLVEPFLLSPGEKLSIVTEGAIAANEPVFAKVIFDRDQPVLAY